MFYRFIQGLWKSGKVTEDQVNEFVGTYLTQEEAADILNSPQK